MAKRVAPLTALQLSKLKPDPTKTIELVDGAVPGLRLRVTPAGEKSWSLAMRANGVMRRFNVGASLGLADARSKASIMRRDIQAGADPTAEKRAKRLKAMAAVQGIGTFGSIINAYFSIGNGGGLKTAKAQEKHLTTFFKPMLSRPAMDIRSSELQLAIDAHAAKVTAARTVGYLNPVLKWATKRELMCGPFSLEKPIAGAPEQRFLTEAELKKLLPTFGDQYGVCCQFLLLTAARRSEAVNATWDQFDLMRKIWTIPGDERKDTRSQIRRKGRPKEALQIPLSDQAVSIIQQLADKRERDTCSLSDRVFQTEQGGPLINWSRWLRRNGRKSGVTSWSAHALRRTAATIAGDLGAAPHVISAMLGHSNIGGQLVAGYNKSRYFEEHKELMTKLGSFVEALSQS